MSVSLAESFSSHASSTPAALRSEQVIAASTGWRAGPAEVSRNLEEVFRGLALNIKFQGVSAAALGQAAPIKT